MTDSLQPVERLKRAITLPTLVVEFYFSSCDEIKNSIKEQNLIMIIFQESCLTDSFIVLLDKDIKKKRKLFLGFKLTSQSSFF